MNRKNIILIGMPGAGKSTIGVLLAKAMKMSFIDTDLLIQERETMTLQEIINYWGLQKFLQAEQQAILELEVKGHVIATGGSAIYSKSAMEHLKKEGIIVYLELPYKEIEKRINNITTRGIAMGTGQTLQEIYDRRVPLYENAADITVDCSGRSMEEVVEKILTGLKKFHTKFFIDA